MTPCVEWAGCRDPNGYGRLSARTRGHKTQLAHRVAWMDARGPIPRGLHVLHTCDNPPCVNLDHLVLGTNADNIADRVAKGRSRSGSMPGESNPWAKLTAEKVACIREHLALGEQQRPLARVFGVSQATISQIKRGVRWTT